MTSKIVPPSYIAAAWIVALTHLLFTVLIQIENFLFYVEPSGFFSVILWWLKLPFIQLENLIIAGLLAFLTFGLLAAKLHRTSLVIIAFVNLYLIFDQLAYKYFYDHLSIDLFDLAPSMEQFTRKLFSHSDIIFTFNFIYWASINWFLYKLIFRNFQLKSYLCTRCNVAIFSATSMQLIGVIFVGVSLFITVQGDHFNLERHALFSAVGFAFPPPFSNVEVNSVNNIFKPRFGGLEEKSEDILRENIFDKVVKTSDVPLNYVVVSYRLPLLTSAQQQQLYERLKAIAPSHIFHPNFYHPFPTIYGSEKFAMWPPSNVERSELQGQKYFSLWQQLVSRGYAVGTAEFSQNDSTATSQKMNNFSLVEMTETSEKALQGKIKMDAWFRNLQDTQPFFLQITQSLFQRPSSNAVNEAIEGLNELFLFFQNTGRLQDTVIFIHGFTQWQQQNPDVALGERFTKGFLFSVMPRFTKQDLVDNRAITLENLAETINSEIDFKHKQKYKNIFDDDFQSTIIYFFDPRNTGTWGLRDGRWKFLSSTLGNNVSLYDLIEDPNELRNIASSYPNRTALYQKLAAKWYEKYPLIEVQNNSHFLTNSMLRIRRIETAIPGPKKIHFGFRSPDGGKGEFKKNATFNSFDPFAVYVQWVEYDQAKTVDMEWSSPSGKHEKIPFTVQQGWISTWITPPMGLPMEEGLWSFSISELGKPVLARDFRVSKNVPMQDAITSKMAVLEQINTGFYEEREGRKKFQPGSILLSQQRPVVWTQWRQSSNVRLIKFRWRSPSGKIVEDSYGLRGDWQETWVDYEGKLPLEQGEWQVSIWQGRTLLKEISFSVVASINEKTINLN